MAYPRRSNHNNFTSIPKSLFFHSSNFASHHLCTKPVLISIMAPNPPLPLSSFSFGTFIFPNDPKEYSGNDNDLKRTIEIIDKLDGACTEVRVIVREDRVCRSRYSQYIRDQVPGFARSIQHCLHGAAFSFSKQRYITIETTRSTRSKFQDAKSTSSPS